MLIWLLGDKMNSNNNFLISGDDKNFKIATIKIDNDKLVVYSDEVTNPVAVRYAWSNTAEAS